MPKSMMPLSSLDDYNKKLRNMMMEGLSYDQAQASLHTDSGQHEPGDFAIDTADLMAGDEVHIQQGENKHRFPLVQREDGDGFTVYNEGEEVPIQQFVQNNVLDGGISFHRSNTVRNLHSQEPPVTDDEFQGHMGQSVGGFDQSLNDLDFTSMTSEDLAKIRSGMDREKMPWGLDYMINGTEDQEYSDFLKANGVELPFSESAAAIQEDIGNTVVHGGDWAGTFAKEVGRRVSSLFDGVSGDQAVALQQFWEEKPGEEDWMEKKQGLDTGGIWGSFAAGAMRSVGVREPLHEFEPVTPVEQITGLLGEVFGWGAGWLALRGAGKAIAKPLIEKSLASTSTKLLPRILRESAAKGEKYFTGKALTRLQQTNGKEFIKLLHNPNIEVGLAKASKDIRAGVKMQLVKKGTQKLAKQEGATELLEHVTTLGAGQLYEQVIEVVDAFTGGQWNPALAAGIGLTYMIDIPFDRKGRIKKTFDQAYVGKQSLKKYKEEWISLARKNNELGLVDPMLLDRLEKMKPQAWLDLARPLGVHIKKNMAHVLNLNDLDNALIEAQSGAQIYRDLGKGIGMTVKEMDEGMNYDQYLPDPVVDFLKREIPESQMPVNGMTGYDRKAKSVEYLVMQMNRLKDTNKKNGFEHVKKGEDLRQEMIQAMKNGELTPNGNRYVNNTLKHNPIDMYYQPDDAALAWKGIKQGFTGTMVEGDNPMFKARYTILSQDTRQAGTAILGAFAQKIGKRQAEVQESQGIPAHTSILEDKVIYDEGQAVRVRTIQDHISGERKVHEQAIGTEKAHRKSVKDKLKKTNKSATKHAEGMDESHRMDTESLPSNILNSGKEHGTLMDNYYNLVTDQWVRMMETMEALRPNKKGNLLSRVMGVVDPATDSQTQLNDIMAGIKNVFGEHADGELIDVDGFTKRVMEKFFNGTPEADFLNTMEALELQLHDLLAKHTVRNMDDVARGMLSGLPAHELAYMSFDGRLGDVSNNAKFINQVKDDWSVYKRFMEEKLHNIAPEELPKLDELDAIMKSEELTINHILHVKNKFMNPTEDAKMISLDLIHAKRKHAKHGKLAEPGGVTDRQMIEQQAREGYTDLIPGVTIKGTSSDLTMEQHLQQRVHDFYAKHGPDANIEAHIVEEGQEPVNALQKFIDEVLISGSNGETSEKGKFWPKAAPGSPGYKEWSELFKKKAKTKGFVKDHMSGHDVVPTDVGVNGMGEEITLIQVLKAGKDKNGVDKFDIIQISLDPSTSPMYQIDGNIIPLKDRIKRNSNGEPIAERIYGKTEESINAMRQQAENGQMGMRMLDAESNSGGRGIVKRKGKMTKEETALNQSLEDVHNRTSSTSSNKAEVDAKGKLVLKPQEKTIESILYNELPMDVTMVINLGDLKKAATALAKSGNKNIVDYLTDTLRHAHKEKMFGNKWVLDRMALENIAREAGKQGKPKAVFEQLRDFGIITQLVDHADGSSYTRHMGKGKLKSVGKGAKEGQSLTQQKLFGKDKKKAAAKVEGKKRALSKAEKTEYEQLTSKHSMHGEKAMSKKEIAKFKKYEEISVGEMGVRNDHTYIFRQGNAEAIRLANETVLDATSNPYLALYEDGSIPDALKVNAWFKRIGDKNWGSRTDDELIKIMTEAHNLPDAEQIDFDEDFVKFLFEMSQDMDMEIVFAEGADFQMRVRNELVRLNEVQNLSKAEILHRKRMLAALPYIRAVQHHKVGGVPHEEWYRKALGLMAIPAAFSFVAPTVAHAAGQVGAGQGVDIVYDDSYSGWGWGMLAAGVGTYAALRYGKGKGLSQYVGRSLKNKVSEIKKAHKMEKKVVSIKELSETQAQELTYLNDALQFNAEIKALDDAYSKAKHVDTPEFQELKKRYTELIGVDPDNVSMNEVYQTFGNISKMYAAHSGKPLKANAKDMGVYIENIYTPWLVAKVHPEVFPYVAANMSRTVTENRWLAEMFSQLPTVFSITHKKHGLDKTTMQHIDNAIYKYVNGNEWNNATQEKVRKFLMERDISASNPLDKAGYVPDEANVDLAMQAIDEMVGVLNGKVEALKQSRMKPEFRAKYSKRKGNTVYFPEDRGKGDYIMFLYDDPAMTQAVRETGAPTGEKGLLYWRRFEKPPSAEEKKKAFRAAKAEWRANGTEKGQANYAAMEKMHEIEDFSTVNVKSSRDIMNNDTNAVISNLIHISEEKARGAADAARNLKRASSIDGMNKKSEDFKASAAQLKEWANSDIGVHTISAADGKNYQIDWRELTDIPGFEHVNAIENFIKNARGNAAATARKAQIDMYKKADDVFLMSAARNNNNTANWLKKHKKFALYGPDSHRTAKWVGRLKYLFYMTQLSLNVASPIINMTGIGTIVPQELTKRARAMGVHDRFVSTRLLGAAIKDLGANIKTVARLGKDQPLPNWEHSSFVTDEKNLLQRLAVEGHTGQTLATEFSPDIAEVAVGQGRWTANTDQGFFKDKLAALDFYGTWLFSKSEETVRNASSLAAWRLEKKANPALVSEIKTGKWGPQQEGAYQRVVGMNTNVNIDYNPWNRPGGAASLSGIFSPIFTFRSFMLNYLHTLALHFDEAIKIGAAGRKLEPSTMSAPAYHAKKVGAAVESLGSKEYRKQFMANMKPVAQMLMGVTLFGGMQALPGADYIEEAVAQDHVPTPWGMPDIPIPALSAILPGGSGIRPSQAADMWLTDALGESGHWISEALTKGVPGLLGAVGIDNFPVMTNALRIETPMSATDLLGMTGTYAEQISDWKQNASTTMRQAIRNPGMYHPMENPKAWADLLIQSNPVVPRGVKKGLGFGARAVEKAITGSSPELTKGGSIRTGPDGRPIDPTLGELITSAFAFNPYTKNKRIEQRTLRYDLEKWKKGVRQPIIDDYQKAAAKRDTKKLRYIRSKMIPDYNRMINDMSKKRKLRSFNTLQITQRNLDAALKNNQWTKDISALAREVDRRRYNDKGR